MAITVVSNTSNNSTITINDGTTINDVFISKVSVFSNTEAQTVTIQWDETHYITAPYGDFATPSGTSAAAVEEAIAALLTVPGSSQVSITLTALSAGLNNSLANGWYLVTDATNSAQSTNLLSDLGLLLQVITDNNGNQTISGSGGELIY